MTWRYSFLSTPQDQRSSDPHHPLVSNRKKITRHMENLPEEEKKIKKFPGFPAEKQTWDFPSVINGYVALLNGAQFKVLWYILRHTYGWQKTQDAISISQFMNGIKRKSDNEMVDSGTGLCRQEVIDSLRELEAMGFIEVDRKKGKLSIYKPRLVYKVDSGSLESRPVGSLESRHTIPNVTIPNITIKEKYIKRKDNGRGMESLRAVVNRMRGANLND